MTEIVGTLYLLHFEPAFKHAQHYLGWTSNVEVRVERHCAGRGSPLVKAAIEAGCVVSIAWTKGGTRSDERNIKAKRKNSRDLCPICREKRKDDDDCN